MVIDVVRRAWLASALVALAVGCGGDDPVDPDLNVLLERIEAGIQHTCGLSATGDAFCWGWNRDGQLGDGSQEDRSVPVAVRGGVQFADITGGGGHT
jgi:alpha-tubulin suppressor-like RCC1 family protein